MPIKLKQVDWRAVRDDLLPTIQETEKKNGHKFANEIDNALLSSRAFLFVSGDGFLVLEPRTRKGVAELMILFAWNIASNAICRYQKDVELLARQIGARSIVLQTAVKKLAPLFLAQGFVCESEETDPVTFWRLTL